MKLTGRGWAALAVAVVAVALSLTFGQPALNAVGAPALGALGYGAVSLWRSEPPTATVTEVPPGFPESERTVAIDLDGRGVLRIRHEWPDGLDGAPLDAIVSPPTAIEADLTLADRGVYDLGDLTAWRRDPLGLVASPAAVDLGATVVVYPSVYRDVPGSALSPLLADDHRVERQAFDALREYRPGDPLRQIHWKSSARHDDFLVTEFAPDHRTETLTIAAEAAPGRADAMATAAGTVALQALRAGLDVGLQLPADSLSVGSGSAHRAGLLSILARTDHGSVPPSAHADSDVSIRATRQETVLEASGTQVFLDGILEDTDARPIREVSGA